MLTVWHTAKEPPATSVRTPWAVLPLCRYSFPSRSYPDQVDNILDLSQILKKFTSGGAGGGGSQSQLISMAMAEASKLFDQSGGAASGNKQDAVNGAAMTVMKMLVQSKFSGGTMGGGNSGGLSGLMGLVSLFAHRNLPNIWFIRCFLGIQVYVN